MDGTSIRRDPLLVSGTPAGVHALAAGLLEHGHRRLAWVAPAAIAAPPPLTAVSPPMKVIAVDNVADALDRAFFTVFRGTIYPTGVVCADMATAEAAMRSLRLLGFRIPADIAVVWGAPVVAAA